MTIRIETEDGNSFDAFTSAEVLTSIVRSSEASFEVGDDGSWRDLNELANLGTKFVAYVDETPRVRGRVEVLSSDVDPQRSSTVRFVVRSPMSELERNDVDLSLRVKNATLKEVIEAAVSRNVGKEIASEPAPRIIYKSDVSRYAMTGKKSRGGKVARDLPGLTEQEAAPQPGETKKDFIDRHIMRHGLMMRDGPDGEIVIGEPDDEQEAFYFFRCLLGEQSKYNNCLLLARTRDAGDAPTHLTVFGKGGGGGKARNKLSAIRTNEELIALGFDRRRSLIEDGIKNKDMAERTAARAYAERVRKVETIQIEVDGHSQDEGGYRVAYAPDTTADLIFETVGGPLGLYYVEQTLNRVNTQDGEKTQLQLVRSGTWSL